MYKHKQEGWGIMAVGVVLGLVPLIILLTIFEEQRGRIIIAGAILLVLVAIVLLRTLTIEVDMEKIILRFGPGLFNKEFKIEEVESCQVVRIWPFLEWGISYYPKRGWVYSVSGLDAVEITLKNGKKYRIGTNQPINLIEAIQAKLKK